MWFFKKGDAVPSDWYRAQHLTELPSFGADVEVELRDGYRRIWPLRELADGEALMRLTASEDTHVEPVFEGLPGFHFDCRPRAKTVH